MTDTTKVRGGRRQGSGRPVEEPSTIIKIKVGTQAMLDEYKQPGETYDAVVRRLLAQKSAS